MFLLFFLFRILRIRVCRFVAESTARVGSRSPRRATLEIAGGEDSLRVGATLRRQACCTRFFVFFLLKMLWAACWACKNWALNGFRPVITKKTDYLLCFVWARANWAYYNQYHPLRKINY